MGGGGGGRDNGWCSAVSEQAGSHCNRGLNTVSNYSSDRLYSLKVPG